MSDLKSISKFLDELVTTFPEIAEEVRDEDYHGLLGLQIGCLTRFTQKAIDTNDLSIVAKSFKFVGNSIDKVEFSIENSLAISFLVKLNIPLGSPAERLLPDKLQMIRNQILTHYK